MLWLLLNIACKKEAPPASTPPAPVAVQQAPEEATGCRPPIEPTTSTGGIVVSAHPEATRIGADVLEAGGTAMDAATAMAVALTLVEPQSSGIGGGAFMLHYDAASGEITAWDGRETAPASGSPEMFMKDGEPRPWPDVVPGGLSVGVPGVLRMLEGAHAKHGRTPFPDLLRPTADLARKGFTVTARMAESVVQMETRQDVLRKHPAAKAYFYPDGKVLSAGHVLKNPALAETIDTLAEQGLDSFYGGELGQHIVDAVASAPINPATLTLDDLSGYRAIEREPVCVPFAGRSACGHPPPTSGGITTLQILAMLDGRELGPPESPEFVHLFSDAVALAWADRDRYIADPRVGVPTEALLAPEYLRERAAMLQASTTVEPVPGDLGPVPADPISCPSGKDTTHLVAADAEGNVVSMTSSIENAFGSGVFVDGYLLNNQLTDFSRDPGTPEEPIANAAAACKRPRSSMSPLIVLDPDGKVELAVGSPGGAAIIQYTSRVVLGVLAQGDSLQTTIERPNIVRFGPNTVIENDCGRPKIGADTLSALEALGHTVVEGSFNSGLHGIHRTAAGWVSGIDPRRDGEAIAVEASD